MSTHLETESLAEAAEILAWRYETLLEAGYPDRCALQLATSGEVDLHLACDLIAHGCPPGTAVRILA